MSRADEPPTAGRRYHRAEHPPSSIAGVLGCMRREVGIELDRFSLHESSFSDASQKAELARLQLENNILQEKMVNEKRKVAILEVSTDLSLSPSSHL